MWISWCRPSSTRRWTPSSASTAATWVFRQSKSASSAASSSRPTTLQPRLGSRTTTSLMLWCREEEEEEVEEDVVGVELRRVRGEGLGIPSPHLGCLLSLTRGGTLSGVLTPRLLGFPLYHRLRQLWRRLPSLVRYW